MATLVEIPCESFDLAMTMESGQIFYHQPAPDGGHWFLCGDAPVWLRQTRADCVESHAATAQLATHYFSLDHPIREILASFPRDPWLDAAVDFCKGMRILRQPVWECLATFITSAQKQVWHIRQISQILRERYGQPLVTSDGTQLHTYPAAATVAGLVEEDLRACALGYRAKHLLGAARAVHEGEVDLESIRSMPDDAARAELCKVPGVGEKVANCVLLFAYERVRAFPVDVWIERILKERYLKRKRKVTPATMREFAASYFGPNGGYAQQYLFHHARKTWKKS